MTDTQVYPVIVLGGGMAGAATAENLARRGQRPLLIEQFEPGHRRGSSHGDGRIIRYAYAEPEYVAMARLAYPLWEELGQRFGAPLIVRCGGWDCDVAESRQLAQTEANFRAYDVPYEWLTPAESNRRFPQFHLEPGSLALYHPDGGAVRADRAVQALWQLAQASGATAITHERIRAIEPHADGVTLRGESGRNYRGARLVVTAGSWAGQLLHALGLNLPLRVLQVQVAHYPILDATPHTPDAMPYFIDYHDRVLFYGLPQLETPGVKVGWHTSNVVLDDPDTEQPFDPANQVTTQAFVRRRFPHLGTEPLQTIICRYTMTPDENFILDRHPKWPHIVIGAGFSGHGFKFAPALGEILADLALEQTPRLPLAPFAWRRFAV